VPRRAFTESSRVGHHDPPKGARHGEDQPAFRPQFVTLFSPIFLVIASHRRRRGNPWVEPSAFATVATMGGAPPWIAASLRSSQ
jgi:hypothetical protein